MLNRRVSFTPDKKKMNYMADLFSNRRNQPASSRLYHLVAARNPRRQSRRVAFDGRYHQGIG